MRKAIILCLLACFLATCMTRPAWADGRQYIGDQAPNTMGNSFENVKTQAEQELSLLPFFTTYDKEAERFWIFRRWPMSAYYFQTAPTSDGGFFQEKMQDAAASVLDATANLVFFLPKWEAYLACETIVAAFNDIIARNICGFVSDGVRAIGSQMAPEHLSGLIFMLALIVLGLAIALYIMRGQIMRALSRILIAVFCLMGFYLYIGNVGVWIPNVMEFINNASGVALISTTVFQSAPIINEYDGSSTGFNESSPVYTKPIVQSLNQTTNAMWHIFVGAPWAVGEFGHADPNRLKLTNEQLEYFNSHLPQGKQEIPAESYSDTVWLATGPEWELTLIKTLTQSDHPDPAAVVASGQGGKSGMHHVFAALTTVLPATVFLIFAFVVGLPVFFSQVMIMVMLFILPLALLLGMAGDGGLALMLKFLKALLGFLATKVIYGFYIGLTLMLAMAIGKTGNLYEAPGTASFLLAVLFGFAIYYHKKFFNGVLSIISFSPGSEHHHGIAQWVQGGMSFLKGAAVAGASAAGMKMIRGGGFPKRASASGAPVSVEGLRVEGGPDDSQGTSGQGKTPSPGGSPGAGGQSRSTRPGRLPGSPDSINRSGTGGSDSPQDSGGQGPPKKSGSPKSGGFPSTNSKKLSPEDRKNEKPGIYSGDEPPEIDPNDPYGQAPHYTNTNDAPQTLSRHDTHEEPEQESSRGTSGQNGPLDKGNSPSTSGQSGSPGPRNSPGADKQSSSPKSGGFPNTNSKKRSPENRKNEKPGIYSGDEPSIIDPDDPYGQDSHHPAKPESSTPPKKPSGENQ